MKYRELVDGETLQIGDEYFSQGQWVTLREAEFKEWVSYTTTYQSSHMCRFRRSLNPEKKNVELSKQILEAYMQEANTNFFK